MSFYSFSLSLRPRPPTWTASLPVLISIRTRQSVFSLAAPAYLGCALGSHDIYSCQPTTFILFYILLVPLPAPSYLECLFVSLIGAHRIRFFLVHALRLYSLRAHVLTCLSVLCADNQEQNTNCFLIDNIHSSSGAHATHMTWTTMASWS